MSRAFLPTVLIGLITVLAISTTTSADTPDCPYPCLPPPISGGAINSYPPPPPQPSTGDGGGGFGGSYPPPPPGSYQLTPPGMMPGGFSPPYNGFPSGPAPPPPNPVLPWFPWYYQHTNQITGTSASSPAMDGRSRITVAVLLPFSLLVLLLPVL